MKKSKIKSISILAAIAAAGGAAAGIFTYRKRHPKTSEPLFIRSGNEASDNDHDEDGVPGCGEKDKTASENEEADINEEPKEKESVLL